MTKKLRPMHPGEVLREEYLVPLNLRAYTVAKDMGLPRTRIERVAEEKTSITAETALYLGKYFGTTPAFWMNLQTAYDLEIAALESGKAVARIERYKSEAA